MLGLTSLHVEAEVLLRLSPQERDLRAQASEQATSLLNYVQSMTKGIVCACLENSTYQAHQRISNK